MKAVYKNTYITFFSQIVTLILKFGLQKVFIMTLGIEYLGYNAVFTNILQMLNMADFGVGIAITSFLYKPLAENNYNDINALIHIYKKFYHQIGLGIFALGGIILVLIPYIVADANCSNSYLRFLFFINLVGTVSSYFLAYKRTLTIAQQKAYFVNGIDLITNTICTLLQIITLFFFSNYMLYLCLNVIKNIVSNAIISLECKKRNPYLGKELNKEIESKYIKPLVSYIKDIFVSRVGAFIYHGTDNIIISAFKGSILAGYLSNYSIVTTALQTIITQIFIAQQATYGNYIIIEKNKKKQREMTDNYYYISFIIANLCLVCCINLFDPFIRLYLGNEFLLGYDVVILLSINLALTILCIVPSQIFAVFKLYHYDKKIVAVSALVNIIVSILLVKSLGISGVLIGTLITSLIYIFSRLYIISQKVFNISYAYYFNKILKYFLISICTIGISHLTLKKMCYNSWSAIVWTGLYLLIISLAVPTVLTIKTPETLFIFRALWENSFLNKVKKYFNKFFVLCSCIIIAGFILLNLQRNVCPAVNVDNKSLKRIDSYIEDIEIPKEKYFHISIDDTIKCFKDITNKENQYESIFDNTTFAWFRELHDKYGVVISCFVFYEDGDFYLEQCTRKFKQEFIKNSDWLRFGFHSADAETAYGKGGERTDILSDYQITVKNLCEIVGKKSIDNVIRLQSYKGTYDDIFGLVNIPEEPVIGLFCADDSRKNYYLDNERNQYIYCHDKLFDTELDCALFSTDIRAEYVESVKEKIEEFSTDAWNNQLDDLVVFTHEWALDPEVKNTMEEFCRYAVEKGYRFIFFEDREELTN